MFTALYSHLVKVISYELRDFDAIYMYGTSNTLAVHLSRRHNIFPRGDNFPGRFQELFEA